MYTAPQQEHNLPQRQPSFIGLPPISPGPEFGSVLGISSAEFGLIGDKDDAARDRDLQGLVDRRAASPPAAAAPAVVPVPRSLPSPQSWINAASAANAADATDNKAGSNLTHTRADSSSGASAAPSSPSMNNYSTQPVSTYRPSQGQSVHMQGAYAVHTQPPQSQQQFAHQPVGQSYQNGAQYTVTVNGNSFQHQQHPYQQHHQPQEQQQQQLHQQPQQPQQQQQHFIQPNPQNGGQYTVNGDGNGISQQQYQQHQQQQQSSQPGSQYAVQNGQPSFAGNPQGGAAPASYQQFATSSGTPRGMPSPSLAQNGTFILPPGWKAEESHLQQPLSSPRHRASPSISSLKQQPTRDAYEIDKETGALSTRSVSPPTQSPGNMRRLIQDASGASSSHGYAPPNPPFAQHSQSAPGSSGGQSSQNGFAPPNPPFAQQDHGAPLGRTSTNNTQGSDRPESKRSSRVFSSIRNRLGGNMNDDVTGDGVSDASALSDEQAKKGPSNFFGLRGNGQPASEGRASYDIGGNPERSYFEEPSEKKRNFFTRPTAGMGFGSSGQTQSSRPGTSESYGGMSGIAGMSSPPIVGFGPSVPRKNRFSKITGMLNRDAKSENQLPQPQGFNNQNPIGRPSLTGQRPFQGMQMGPVGGAQMDTPNRSRAASAAAETRPSFGDYGRNASAHGFMSPPGAGQMSEEDRGRKVSAGNILSKFIGKRSESKTREQQGQPSPPGLGQPQGMMDQGQSPPRPGQPGQFPSFLAHSMGMPGQPPVLPPQGQYAGLAQQVHQNQHQQQMLGQPQPPLGLTSGRLGAYLQGGPSPGVSPVTQSSGSPFTTQAPGSLNVDTRQGTPQPNTQAALQQRPQGPQSPVAVVQVATAVPIRQVERSPNSNSQSGGFSGQISPQDSTRGRSSSVVNQIDVSGPRRPLLDAQGRIRSGSSALSQSNNTQTQQPVHIASLQAQVRKPVHPLSPQNSAYLEQDSSSIDTEKHESIGHSSQDSPTATRVSGTTAYHSQSASQTTPSTSPAPSQEQQPKPPHGPPKSIDSGLAQQYQPNQSQPSAPSPSIYRPSGPQPVHAVQQLVQSPPAQWGAASPSQADFQNHAGQPGQSPAQYSMQGRPPQDMMMMTPPLQGQNADKEGAFSRMLKTSKTFVQERTSSEKPRSEREKLGAKLLGAFKKTKQAEATIPTPPALASGPPGGPAWGATQMPQQLQRPAPPMQTQSAPLPTPQVVTEGLQQMPSKAQQLLGQPPNAMYQAPADQPPPKARRSSTETADSQPYVPQEERQPPGKTTPPLSPDHIGAAPATTATATQPPQTSQPDPGRPSISSLPPNNGPQRPSPPQQQQQQQQSTQPRPSFDKPKTGIAAAQNRAKNLKQQIAQNDQQQYAPVAIPQAYAPVYAGRAAPVPVPAPVYAQPMMPYPAQQQQQWVHPSMMQGIVPGQMAPHMVQQGVYQQYPPYQGTPPPVANAGYQAPPQQYAQAQQSTPTAPNQGQIPSPGMPGQQQVQQNVQQSSQQPMSQQAWEQTQRQPETQQTPAPPQQANSLPSEQTTPVPSQTVYSPPATSTPVVPAIQQQSTVAQDAVTASPVPVNDAQTQMYQPSPVKPKPSSPPNQNVPQSSFSVEAMPEQGQLQPPQSSNGDLMPQRQISGASQVSSLTTEPATNKGSPDIERAQVAQPVQTPVSDHSARPASPEHQLARVTLKDEPMPRTDSPATSASVDNDDLYGATPRQSAVAAQEQYPVEHIIISGPVEQSPTDESESKFAGMPTNTVAESQSEQPGSGPKAASPAQQHFIVDATPVINEPNSAAPDRPAPETSPVPPTSADSLERSSKPTTSPEEEPPSPTESELKPEEAKRGAEEEEEDNENGGKINTINGKPVQSSQEIFEEHKRKQLVRDMEEKIAVMPEPAMLEPPKKIDDVPMMSATSYPGQEWNPYGDGFEEDDE
ncbi:hypothetical protein N0V82_002973 [Gnomoniopsis sp. IMI 355080]|nr:hypothetical protein N0V82_002973 [Gnomoniopsis sp. IMI 355080]